MKKIAYIELDTHAEIAGNFMDLMSDSKEFSVDYFFSEKILKNLGLKENQTVKLSAPEIIIHQLSLINYDLVIIGTAHRYFNVFEQISENFNTSVIVHNLNFSKISKFELLQNIFKKDVQYRLKLLLKDGLLSAPNVYQKAKNLLVLDENLASNNFKFLPIFYTKDYPKLQNQLLRVVVPGSVSQERRDYKHILEKIKTFKSKIEIIFLGKAKGDELKWIEKTPTPKLVALKYSQEKVPSKIYDAEMELADVLWCPIQKETEFFSQKEIYGETKMSGNIGDAIKFGKMAIFPEDFSNKYPFIIHEKEDIETQLFSIDEKDFYDFSKDYAKPQVLEKLTEVLKQLI